MTRLSIFLLLAVIHITVVHFNFENTKFRLHWNWGMGMVVGYAIGRRTEANLKAAKLRAEMDNDQ